MATTHGMEVPCTGLGRGNPRVQTTCGLFWRRPRAPGRHWGGICCSVHGHLLSPGRAASEGAPVQLSAFRPRVPLCSSEPGEGGEPFPSLRLCPVDFPRWFTHGLRRSPAATRSTAPLHLFPPKYPRADTLSLGLGEPLTSEGPGRPIRFWGPLSFQRAAVPCLEHRPSAPMTSPLSLRLVTAGLASARQHGGGGGERGSPFSSCGNLTNWEPSWDSAFSFVKWRQCASQRQHEA